jgi:sporulation protein YlmC with PRC-barrel domain
MIRIFLPLICAALGFAAASCSQSGTPFGSTEAPAPPPSTPHEHEAAAAAMPVPSPSDPSDPPALGAQSTAEPDEPSSTPVERRASTLIGLPVVSTDGSPLGEVKDIIFDRQGRATHLVLAYASQSDGKLTAMPWDAAVASMKDDHLVLDGSKLQDAPSFTPDAWPDLDDPAWSASTDTYWRKAVEAAIAAHPGAPIDSTDRQRGRRARSGDGNPPP